MAIPDKPTYGFRRLQTSKTRGTGLNSGVQKSTRNAITKRENILWVGWRGRYAKIIRSLNLTSTYQDIFSRFIKHQDNLFIVPVDMGTTFGRADDRGTNGYTIRIGYNGFLYNGQLTADPTFIAKVVMHEGLHTRYHMARNENKLPEYPTVYRHYQLQKSRRGYEGDHQAMAEGNVGTLIQGMKEFDKVYGLTHSGDWYTAIAWWGSLSRATSNWQNMASALKARYEQIQANEDNYMRYLLAKAIYSASPNEGNKTQLSIFYQRVNWSLFRRTRSR